MTLQSVDLADTLSFVNGNINSKISHTINVNKGVGISQVYLDISITPVGAGAITLTKMAPFGIISNLTVRDQNSRELFSLNAWELVFLSLLQTKRPPFENVMYNDGSNGWVPVAAATDPATTEEIRGSLALPIRLPQGHNVSKLTFDIQLTTTNSTTGWTQLLDFATSATSISGSFTPHVEYDDSINHAYQIIKATEAAIGTSFQAIGDLPEGRLMRYAIVYLDDYWETHAATTDDQLLINEIEYESAIGIKPIRLNRFSARHIMHDLLDIDPDFVLGNTSSLCYNMAIIPFPDTMIGENSQFRLKNDSSQDATLVVVLVDPFASQEEVRVFSPASVGRLIKG